MNSSTIGKYLFFAANFIFWIFLSLFSSKLIVDNLTSGHEYSNFMFNLHYLKNSGAAFSLMQDSREFLIIVSVVAVTLLVLYVHNRIRSINYLSVSFIALLAAGIMSNCHERISLGYVRDYVQLNFFSFPVFNVADVFITVGVIALIIILLLYKGR